MKIDEPPPNSPGFDNSAARELIDLGVIEPSNCVRFAERCRDAEVAVFRCTSSGVVFIEKDHLTQGVYYAQKNSYHSSGPSKPDEQRESDELRRKQFLLGLINGGRYLDVGSGECRLPLMLRPECEFVAAIEPQVAHQKRINPQDLDVYSSLDEISDAGLPLFSVASLFHVLEHVHHPTNFLRKTSELVRDSGKVVIEVPHAGDVLLNRFESQSFKEFTLWSEHLVLHTEESLSSLISAAGMDVESLHFVQRYPLANHLYWLSRGQPGGHEVWNELSNSGLDRAYQSVLATNRETDTLVAVARVTGADTRSAEG